MGPSRPITFCGLARDMGDRENWITRKIIPSCVRVNAELGPDRENLLQQYAQEDGEAARDEDARDPVEKDPAHHDRRHEIAHQFEKAGS